ncbi:MULTISPECIES: wax ester/triacylglycerol synthase domain-containing protein [Gordonia]|uniref:diacylglycerol O-acyltransferase n=1 Tax=Gordonia sihwensis NBRC 108236 TaxID=1223544 RepID=L7LJS5_9ACTN|nr:MULTISPECIES: wax ester/triacylglycerol synthase domain-containing protein [Gordonia]AUH68143.1 DUF1298 domain-containing protein [Gordonia sp. YC-JH1]WFN92113.1 wax ester/triacylglycerol synthase family O-acyltransferase [Gordonia sihwensis]GAC60308.1 hypothetical protein GSI01S_08_01650 [Gordonia sihwensis NBRC 108236]
MARLQPKDALFVYTDGPRSRQMNVATQFFVVDDPATELPAEAVTDWFRARTTGMIFRRCLKRSFLDLDYPVWIEDDDFRFEHHVFLHPAVSESGVLGLLGELAETPMDLTRPLWEVHVIPCPDGFGPVRRSGVAITLRVHHAAADGIEMQTIYAALFGSELPGANGPFAPISVPGDRGHAILRRIRRSVGDFISAADEHRRTLAELESARGDADYPLPPSEPTPTPIDGPVGPRRAVVATHLPWQQVRDIRSAAGSATINDIALTVIGGAMHDYLDAIGSTPAGSLVASVPMTVRPKTADGSLASDDTTEGNNRFVMMTVDLHSTVVDPLERLRAVHDAVLGERERLSHPIEATADDITARYVPPGFVARALRRLREDARGYPRRTEPDGKPFNTSVMTSFRLPFDPQFFGRSRACSVVFGPLNGTGLSHAHNVAGEWMGITALCDRDLIPDPERYAAALRSSYEGLRDAALGATAR